AFQACTQAVQDELTRQIAGSPETTVTEAPAAASQAPTNGHVEHDDRGASRSNRRRSQGTVRAHNRPATGSQVRAILCIANRLDLDLATALRNRFGVEHPSELDVSSAGRFIDELQAQSTGTEGNP